MNISTNPDVQIAKGREALIYFHNDSVIFENYNFRSIEELADAVSHGHPSIFFETLGFTIEQLNTDGFFDGGRVKDSMESFAKRAQGRIPDNMTTFFQALSNEAVQVNWVDAIPYVAKESAVKIGEGLVEVGNTAISTISSLGAVLPLLVVGAVIFIVVQKTKRLAA